MSITLEHCKGDTYVARSGPNHEDHGDPYEMACTIVINGSTATVKGLATDKGLTKDTVREVGNLLKEKGVQTLRIERIRNGKSVEQDWEIQ